MAKKRANGEGSIRKRKDGRWEGRYTAGHDPNTGKTIYKNVLGKTQGEVKEKLKKAIADSQQLDVTRATTYTVKTWIKLWYEVYAEPRLREKTKDYYLNYINNHIIPQLGDIKLDKLSSIQIQKFYNDLQKAGILKSAVIDGVPVYMTRSKELFNYINNQKNPTYPYFVPKKYRI